MNGLTSKILVVISIVVSTASWSSMRISTEEKINQDAKLGCMACHMGESIPASPKKAVKQRALSKKSK